MALENLEPATRIESILDGEDIAPATRLEYFLKQAAAGGGGGGGQSILVATLVLSEDGQTGVLDKTWSECKNADAVIIRESLDVLNDNNFYYVARIDVQHDLLDPTHVTYLISYIVPAIDTVSATGLLEWYLFTLSTDTETGYPEISFTT